MIYQNDPNRIDDHPTEPARDGMGWGVPLGIAAVVLIAGLMFFSSGGNRTTTASNTPATTTQTNPSGPERTTPAPTPAPAPTPPAKTQ